jgi:hypothetical protein
MVTQAAFNFTEKPFPPPNPKWGEDTDNYRLYHHLKIHREILLSEIHHTIVCDTARMRDIRPWLKTHGFNYVVSKVRDSEYLYKVIEVG